MINIFNKLDINDLKNIEFEKEKYFLNIFFEIPIYPQYIAHGEYGSVYSTEINNKQIVIKKFFNDIDYESEKKIYICILPIYIGKINLNDYININNQLIKLSKYNITNNIISIDNQYIIDDIQKILPPHFPIIKSIHFMIKSKITNIDGFDNIFYYKLGTVINKNNFYMIYIDSFKICRLLYFDDINRYLVFQNLGINLTQSFKLIKPDFNQRVFMAIDLIRIVNELIENGIYHNDIKCDNIVLTKIDNNYYLNLIDYGLCLSSKNKLDDYLLTTSNAYSPEYLKINLNYINGIVEIANLKELFDKCSHWILGGIIINILLWENIQYCMWNKYYNMVNSNLKILYLYDNMTIAYEYIKELINKLLLFDDIYINASKSKSINIYNIINTIRKQKSNIELDKFEITMNSLNMNMDYYKLELKLLIANIFNMLEFQTDKKRNLVDIYNQIKDYPSYMEYLKLKFIFI
jgi:serine/threonine protein kinase